MAARLYSGDSELDAAATSVSTFSDDTAATIKTQIVSLMICDYQKTTSFLQQRLCLSLFSARLRLQLEMAGRRQWQAEASSPAMPMTLKPAFSIEICDSARSFALEEGSKADGQSSSSSLFDQDRFNCRLRWNQATQC